VLPVPKRGWIVSKSKLMGGSYQGVRCRNGADSSAIIFIGQS
jgi:hypothetical protein